MMMTNESCAAPLTVGVDFGGTKIRAGLVDGSGRLAAPAETIATAAAAPAETIFSNLVGLVRRTIDRAGARRPAAIGVGATGPLDIGQGVILECNNLPTMHGFPLRERLEEAFCLPVRVDNDANALILGEALYGAGRGYRSVLGFTLGTGIGAARVEEERIVRGATGSAGEIWLSPYRDGILEDFVSGNALRRRYSLRGGDSVDGAEIARRAAAREPAACRVWEEFTEALAFALAWTVNLVDPDAVLLGGSVMRSASLFLDAADERFRSRICPEAAHVPLLCAQLGDDAGVIGAAALFMEKRMAEKR